MQAVSDGSVYNGKPLTMAWQSADGVLSPKIIVPPRSSVSQKRTSSTSKSSGSTSSAGGGSGAGNSGSVSAIEEPRSPKTSISKLLEVCLLLHSTVYNPQGYHFSGISGNLEMSGNSTNVRESHKIRARSGNLCS